LDYLANYYILKDYDRCEGRGLLVQLFMHIIFIFAFCVLVDGGIRSKLKKTKNKIKDVGQKVLDGVKKVGDETKKGAKKGTEKVKDGVRKVKDKVKDELKEVGNKIKEESKRAGRKVTDKVKKAGDKINEIRDKVEEKIMEAAVDGFKKMPDDMKQEMAAHFVMGLIPKEAVNVTIVLLILTLSTYCLFCRKTSIEVVVASSQEAGTKSKTESTGPNIVNNNQYHFNGEVKSYGGVIGQTRDVTIQETHFGSDNEEMDTIDSPEAQSEYNS